MNILPNQLDKKNSFQMSIENLKSNSEIQKFFYNYQDDIMMDKDFELTSLTGDPQEKLIMKSFQKEDNEQLELNQSSMIQTNSNDEDSDNDSDMGTSQSQINMEQYDHMNDQLVKIQKNGKRVYIKRNPEKVRRWTREEAQLYENFIEMYAEIMRDSSSKRNTKIFLLMSQFIGSKTPSQCRSHHQKFYKKLVRQKLTNILLPLGENQPHDQSQIINIEKKKKQKKSKKSEGDENDLLKKLKTDINSNELQIEDSFQINQKNYLNLQESSHLFDFQIKNEPNNNLIGMGYNSILRNNQDLDSFILNPLNIKMENFMNNDNNYDEIDYNKIMSNGEDKTNWKVIFAHMESVEGSIKNLMAMIDNSVILTNIV